MFGRKPQMDKTVEKRFESVEDSVAALRKKLFELACEIDTLYQKNTVIFREMTENFSAMNARLATAFRVNKALDKPPKTDYKLENLTPAELIRISKLSPEDRDKELLKFEEVSKLMAKDATIRP